MGRKTSTASKIKPVKTRPIGCREISTAKDHDDAGQHQDQ